jgi:hypothetical protein
VVADSCSLIIVDSGRLQRDAVRAAGDGYRQLFACCQVVNNQRGSGRQVYGTTSAPGYCYEIIVEEDCLLRAKGEKPGFISDHIQKEPNEL